MHRRALTLVEVLVAIAIVAVLAGILLVALGPSMAAARQARSAANVRSILSAFTAWAETHNDRLPTAEEGQSYPFACEVVFISFGHWNAHMNWPWVISEVLPWGENFDVFVAPGAGRSLSDDRCGAPTSYVYSRSFLARPEVWSGEAQADPTLLDGVRRHEISFPSQKAMLWDWELPYAGDEIRRTAEGDLAVPTPVGFPDEHVETLVPAAGAAPVQNPFTPRVAPRRLHDTPFGVRGRDF